jgi:hypothetical protein
MSAPGRQTRTSRQTWPQCLRQDLVTNFPGNIRRGLDIRLVSHTDWTYKHIDKTTEPMLN